MIKFIDLFPQLKNSFTDYKVHLATGPKDNDPLIAFLQENFKEWQESQTKKNFEREYIISLIFYDDNEWLFAVNAGSTAENDDQRSSRNSALGAVRAN